MYVSLCVYYISNDRKKALGLNYDILSSSRYKGKIFKVVKSGKKIDCPLDENKTLVYSPSGRYFRIQDKEVEARLIVKHTKEFNESKGIRLGKTRSYVTLNGESYEDIEKQITDKYRKLNRKDLNDLVDSTYQKNTHFIDKEVK